MSHTLVSSGSRFEAAVGYSRAVRAGSVVEVAGTTALARDGSVIAPGDPYAQTKAALDRVTKALAEAGAELADVVRTRLFVTDIEHWEAVGRAHAEVIGAIRPASTMVEVVRLIDPQMVVEIEATAVVGSHGEP